MFLDFLENPSSEIPKGCHHLWEKSSLYVVGAFSRSVVLNVYVNETFDLNLDMHSPLQFAFWVPLIWQSSHSASINVND